MNINFVNSSELFYCLYVMREIIVLIDWLVSNKKKNIDENQKLNCFYILL